MLIGYLHKLLQTNNPSVLSNFKNYLKVVNISINLISSSNFRLTQIIWKTSKFGYPYTPIRTELDFS